MEPITSFTLQPVPPLKPEEAQRSLLLADGRPTPTELVGLELKGQWALPGGFLLLVTDDVPYEEILRIYLLSSSFTLVDRRVLGAIYNPASLRGVEVTGAWTLEFSFWGEERWRLSIKPLSGLEARTAPRGCFWVLRRRHLKLERMPSG